MSTGVWRARFWTLWPLVITCIRSASLNSVIIARVQDQQVWRKGGACNKTNPLQNLQIFAPRYMQLDQTAESFVQKLTNPSAAWLQNSNPAFSRLNNFRWLTSGSGPPITATIELCYFWGGRKAFGRGRPHFHQMLSFKKSVCCLMVSGSGKWTIPRSDVNMC